jgi:hypothetical protein
MSNKLETFLSAAGKDVEAVFSDIFTPSNVTAAETLVGKLFPGAGTVFNLIANTAISVEQKFVALGKQSGTGAQKLASVIAIVGSTVTSLLSTNGVTVILADVVNAVVAFLNSINVPTVA